jgi:DNA-binding response OmpR family regulator
MAILYTINQSPAGLPRCEICTAVWGRSDRKVGKKFGVHIFNIRKKLAPAHIKIIHDEGTHLYHLAMSVQNGSDGCDAKSAT